MNVIFRQQQHQKIRAMQATESVYQHNVGKLTAKYETRIAEQERYEIYMLQFSQYFFRNNLKFSCRSFINKIYVLSSFWTQKGD